MTCADVLSRLGAPVVKSAPPFLLLLTACSGQLNLPDVVTYNKDIRPLMQRRCFQCHRPSSPLGDWSQYTIAFNRRDIIYKKVVTQRAMPPGGMSLKEVLLFKKWLDSGAK